VIDLSLHKAGFVDGHPQKGASEEEGYYSTDGEDGVVEKIFESIDAKDKVVVELGAGNGWWEEKYWSNSYRWIKKGWRALLIEGDEARFNTLKESMNSFKKVICEKAFISLNEGQELDSILKKNLVQSDFDLLSIDIDGNDYWVWAELKYRPKVVIIEYNSNWEERISIPYDELHCWDESQFFGASASALERLGHYKGYDLVAFCKRNNLVFLRSDLNDGRFKIMNLNDKDSYIEKDHHRGLSEEQKNRLVLNPSFCWGK